MDHHLSNIDDKALARVADVVAEATTEDCDRIESINHLLAPADGSPTRYIAHSLLGRGGMGVVYRAEQRSATEGGLRRQDVALKVIRLGMNSRQVLARFEAERQALALMSHPGIATVFDAGLLADGRPFFAMEHVPGRPVTAYADEHRLTIAQRLQLFQQVCDAVQHAHSKGVIHRDLKPSNVLAYLDGDTARAKVIDFGLAKALGGRLAEATLHTEVDRAVGTWPYMSPEQAIGDRDIDVRTDVYALGAILYELLAGVPPLDLKEDLSAAEKQRVIREVDPPRPDTRLSGLMAEQQSRVSAARRLGPAELRARLAGELAWIPLKALRKLRAERYETVPALRDDVLRYLSGRPLVAGPDSTVYRLRKFLRRNRGPVAAASAMVVLLAGGVAGSATGWWRAANALAEVRAKKIEVERQKVGLESVQRFLADKVFGAATPERIPDERARQWFVDAIIVPAADDAGKDFRDQPLLEASIRDMLARSYRKIDRNDAAENEANRALTLRRDHLGPDHPDTLDSLLLTAIIIDTRGQSKEAEVRAAPVYRARRQRAGERDPDTLTAQYWYAHFMRARPREAMALAKSAMDLRRDRLGPSHPDTLQSIIQYARFEAEGDGSTESLQDAARLLKEVYDVRAVLPRADRLSAAHYYGYVLFKTGKVTEALQHAKEAFDGRTELLGPSHRNTVLSMALYANCLGQSNRGDEARPLYAEAVDRSWRSAGEDHPTTIMCMHLFAIFLAAESQNEKADWYFSKGLELAEKNRDLGLGHTDTVAIARGYVQFLERLGRRETADQIRRRFKLE